MLGGLLAVAWLTTCSDPIVAPNKPPETPSNPSPADRSYASLIVKLEWRCSDPDEDRLSYDVHFGTDTIPPTAATNYTATSYSLDTLEYDTQYYWNVVAKDNLGAVTIGPVWRFKTRPKDNVPPDLPRNPAPSQSQLDVPITTSLSWTSADANGDPLTHDVYLDAANPPVVLVAGDTSATIIDPPGELLYETDYYWRIVVRDTASHETVGDVWTFRTKNNQSPAVENVYPVNLDTGINPRSLRLVWRSSDPDGDAMTYTVVLDTLSLPVSVARSGLTVPSFSPVGVLYGKKYYWKVRARDTYGNESDGPIWAFTTRPPIALVLDCSADNITGAVEIGSDPLSNSLPNVVSGPEGLWIITCDSGSPSRVGYALSDGRDVAVNESHSFLAAGILGFHVVTPNAEYVGSYDTPGSAVGVVQEGEYAYVADSTQGMWIFDIHDPSNLPPPSQFYDPSLTVTCVTVAAGFAYVADENNNEIKIVDVRDPNAPTLKGSVAVGCADAITGMGAVSNGPSRALYVVGGLDDLACPDGTGLLTVYDLSDPEHPVEGKFIAYPHLPSDVSVGQGWLCVSTELGLITVYDVRKSLDPVVAGFITRSAQAVAIGVTKIYVLSNENLFEFPLSQLE